MVSRLFGWCLISMFVLMILLFCLCFLVNLLCLGYDVYFLLII